MMVKKIRELQFLCALLLFMQLFFFRIGIIFHAMAVMISVIVICNTKMFRCIDATYNYWIIALFLYRIMVRQWYYQYQVCSIVYMVLTVIIIVVLLFHTYRCII